MRGETHIDEGLIGTRFLQANWTGWQSVETAALRGLWSAWWAATPDRHPAPMPAYEVLTVVTVVTGTLRPWLGAWEAVRSPSADRHLEDAVAWWCVEDQLSELKLGFLDEYGRTRIGPRYVAQVDELEGYSSYLHPQADGV